MCVCVCVCGGRKRLKLHVEISICGRLADEEAGAGNNCHSPRGAKGATGTVGVHVNCGRA